MDDFTENGAGPIEMPITDSIDLHTFKPGEVKDLLEEYLSECHKMGLRQVRIIHGKGTGTLRNIVHNILKRSPIVSYFRLAPPESGSWGATVVVLRHE